MKQKDIISNANKREDKLSNRIDILDEKETALKKNEKKQEQNLIETLKQSCRKIIRDRTGKKPYTTINISRI